MEWNAESVLDALNDFERKSEIPEILDQYLERIAKNGEIVFPWNKLKPLLKKKLEFVLDEFYETCPVETSVPVPNFETFNFDNLKRTILQAVDAFTSAPFTIQRLCELVTNPTKHYNRTDKYMRGIEKNVLVVSTVEPRSNEQGDNANNPVVNGVPGDSPRDDNDTNGHGSPDGVSSSSSNLNAPPPSDNHVLLENFANVFPSAVCIPPSADISVDSEVDNNFMESPEQELAPVERIEGTPVPNLVPKEEEEMDTQEDEQSEKEQEMAAEEPTAATDSDSPLEPAPAEGVEDAPSEAVCSVETDPIPESKPVESQQDDTVSQSDDNTRNSDEEPTEENIEVADYISEDVIDKLDDFIGKVGDVVDDVPSQVDAPTEATTDVSEESISTTEVSENPMDSESSSSSNEPDIDVPV